MSSNYGQVICQKAEGKRIDLVLDGVIGDSFWDEGITTKAIRRQVEDAGKVDHIHLDIINSPGGLMHEGMAIYSYLSQHPAYVSVNVLGLAASAATFPLMAADDRQASEISDILIHNARIFLFGIFTKEIMEAVNDEVQQMLTQSDELMALLYHRRSGLSQERISEMMKDDQFMSGSKAKELGFIDTLIPAKSGQKKDSVEAHKEQLSDVWSRWLKEQQDEKRRKQFSYDYKIAASLVPELTARKPEPEVGKKFTTEPWNMQGDGSGLININEQRYLALRGDTDAQDIIDEWKKISNENSLHLMLAKIEFAHRGQTFLLSNKETKMFQEILAALGVDSLPDAIDKIKELTAKAQGAGNDELAGQLANIQTSLAIQASNPGATSQTKVPVHGNEIAQLQSAISTLTSTVKSMKDEQPAVTKDTMATNNSDPEKETLAAVNKSGQPAATADMEITKLQSAISTLTATIKSMQEDRENEKNAKREEAIEVMAKEGYFQDETAIEALRDVYNASPDAFDVTVKEMKRKGPQHAGLLNEASGTGAEGPKREPKSDDPEAKLIAIAEKIAADEKIPFSNALAKAETQNPELIEAIRLGAQKRRAPETSDSISVRQDSILFGESK